MSREDHKELRVEDGEIPVSIYEELTKLNQCPSPEDSLNSMATVELFRRGEDGMLHKVDINQMKNQSRNQMEDKKDEPEIICCGMSLDDDLFGEDDSFQGPMKNTINENFGFEGENIQGQNYSCGENYSGIQNQFPRYEMNPQFPAYGRNLHFSGMERQLQFPTQQNYFNGNTQSPCQNQRELRQNNSLFGERQCHSNWNMNSHYGF